MLFVVVALLAQTALGLSVAPPLREPPILAATLTLGFVAVTAAGAPIDDDAVPAPRRVHPLSPLEQPAMEEPADPAPKPAGD